MKDWFIRVGRAIGNSRAWAAISVMFLALFDPLGGGGGGDSGSGN